MYSTTIFVWDDCNKNHILNKFCSCLLLRHVFSSDRGSAKWSWIFTKPSPNGYFCLPNRLNMLWALHVFVCMHSAWKYARFFYLFLSFFWHFEAFPYWKWKKTEATFQMGIDEAHLFHFINFFPFQSGRPSNWPKCVKNVKKSTF